MALLEGLKLAATPAPTGNFSNIPSIFPTVSTATTPAGVVYWILGWIMWIAGVLAVGYLVYGGIMFITAAGDAEKVTKARNTILYAIIGIIIITMALVLINTAKTITP